MPSIRPQMRLSRTDADGGSNKWILVVLMEPEDSPGSGYYNDVIVSRLLILVYLQTGYGIITPEF